MLWLVRCRLSELESFFFTRLQNPPQQTMKSLKIAERERNTWAYQVFSQRDISAVFLFYFYFQLFVFLFVNLRIVFGVEEIVTLFVFFISVIWLRLMQSAPTGTRFQVMGHWEEEQSQLNHLKIRGLKEILKRTSLQIWKPRVYRECQVSVRLQEIQYK